MNFSSLTSESVTIGHPDKLCDAVSDAVLDAALREDPAARTAVECTMKDGAVYVFGEMSTTAWVDVEAVVRKVLARAGYTNAEFGADAQSAAVLCALGRQSPEIARGVFGTDIGAGDQGMMFGYACDQTPQLMPLPIMLSHRLTARLRQQRESGEAPFLRPDGKAQVSVEYGKNNEAPRVSAVVLSAQHSPDISLEELQQFLKTSVISAELADLITPQTVLHINPAGEWHRGGPAADAGLTGRKIIVDTYGGAAPHGGGAFSGKDGSKVDRSAAYAARHIAKSVVASALAPSCLVQLSYAIGVPQPVDISVQTFGKSAATQAHIAEKIRQHWDLRPAAIIERFGLNKPIFQQTAVGGHFGREDFPWEQAFAIPA